MVRVVGFFGERNRKEGNGGCGVCVWKGDWLLFEGPLEERTVGREGVFLKHKADVVVLLLPTS